MQDSARWDGFVFRADDVVISTPPKCGTTWMQLICGMLILRTTELPRPLSSLSPWMDMQTRPLESVRADLDAQTHRRFVKTHTPLDGLPWDERVTYVHVCRDPRDVALSWANHVENTDALRFFDLRVGAVGADDIEELGVGPPPAPPATRAEAFWRWVEATAVGGDLACLAGLIHHARTFWARRHEANVHLFHYADLRRDLAGEMARVADALGVDPPTADMVEAASFDAMRARADDLVPNADTPFWQDNARFFDRARAGEWATVLDDEGRARYDAIVAELAPPDLAAWVHAGWRGVDAQPS